MNRITLIQEIFKKTNFKKYLEIGCERGYSFLPLKAKYKIGVDPNFNIPKKRKLNWFFKVPENFNNKYFEEKSDDFFLNRIKFLKRKQPIDVVLIDGMHTFRASLNDVFNSLKYLNINGVIVLHDCLPPYKAASTEFCPTIEEQKEIEGWTGIWCGDVWKTIVYLLRNCQEFVDTCVIDTDFGLGVIRPNSKTDYKSLVINEKLFAEIDNLSYHDLELDKLLMLNLKNVDYIKLIIKSITSNAI
tara:strand:- start:6305 stop:7036 length:732 start_codon:yes stop_codon:yes gene_type:complete